MSVSAAESGHPDHYQGLTSGVSHSRALRSLLVAISCGYARRPGRTRPWPGDPFLTHVDAAARLLHGLAKPDVWSREVLLEGCGGRVFRRAWSCGVSV